MDYLISLLYGEQRPIYTELQVNYMNDLMTFDDTLRDGSSFSKVTSLMEHLLLKFVLNISVSLLRVMF